MVETWEIEWNSSMIEHGRDLGTMEFIFAKGGTVADMNYVMFDVQNNSWEPLIKAVAERDNSHPDIIRKNVPISTQQMMGQQQPIFGMPSQDFRPAVPAAGTAVAPNPRAVKQANRAMRSAQAGEAVRGGSTKVGDLAGAGFYGQAALQTGKNIMGAGKRMGQGALDRGGRALSGLADMGGRALTAVKNSGMGQRMKNFMSGAGRAISDLRQNNHSDKCEPREKMRLVVQHLKAVLVALKQIWTQHQQEQVDRVRSSMMLKWIEPAVVSIKDLLAITTLTFQLMMKVNQQCLLKTLCVRK